MKLLNSIEGSVRELRPGDSISESSRFSCSTSNNPNDGKCLLRSDVAHVCNRSPRKAKAGEAQVMAILGDMLSPKLAPLRSKII